MKIYFRRPDPAGPIYLQPWAYDALIAVAAKYKGVTGGEMFTNYDGSIPGCVYGMAAAAGLFTAGPNQRINDVCWQASDRYALGFSAWESDNAYANCRGGKVDDMHVSNNRVRVPLANLFAKLNVVRDPSPSLS